MIYRLINPSDEYTFEAKDRETAALTVFLLGTQYGATDKSDSEDKNVPVFLLGGAREWYEETFGRTPDEGFEELKEFVSDALNSFVLGGFYDRDVYDRAYLGMKDLESWERFKETWNERRTSLNNIGEYAQAMGKRIKGKESES